MGDNNRTKEVKLEEDKDKNNTAKDSLKKSSKTSSGMDQNVAALLAYLVGWITGIIFLFIEKENEFVRFHAMQSIITFGGIMILSFVVGWIPVIGWLIALLLGPFSLIVWIILMVKAYKGEMYKLPIVGKIAEEQVNKIKF